MADSAAPAGPDPKRETLRISLPPRPLKPDSSKISPTPRPNISAATTLPINATGHLVPTPASSAPPAWSTAMTKPMPSVSKPPSGSLPPRPSAPPLSGAQPNFETTPLFPQKSPAAMGVTTEVPETVQPQARAATDPGISGRMGIQPPRVIVANPQAKVFVQSGKVEVPEDLEPIAHRSKPPALPATQALPTIGRSDGPAPTAPSSFRCCRRRDASARSARRY